MDHIEGSEVLEFGVGTGKLVVLYPEKLEVIGIDFSSNMLKRAKETLQYKTNIRLMEMGAEHLSFEETALIRLLHHACFVQSPTKIQGIKEMRRV